MIQKGKRQTSDAMALYIESQGHGKSCRIVMPIREERGTAEVRTRRVHINWLTCWKVREVTTTIPGSQSEGLGAKE